MSKIIVTQKELDTVIEAAKILHRLLLQHNEPRFYYQNNGVKILRIELLEKGSSGEERLHKAQKDRSPKAS